MKTLNLIHWSLKARRTLLVVQLVALFLAFWLSKLSATADDWFTQTALVLILVHIVLYLFTLFAGKDLDPIRFTAPRLDEWQLQYRNHILSKSFATLSVLLGVIAGCYMLLPDPLIWLPQTKMQMSSLLIVLWAFTFGIPLWISMWLHPEFKE